jgi:RNA polymerase-binding transcription factor DksA
MTKTELEKYRRALLAQANRLQGDLQGVKNEALRKTGGEASGNLSNVPLHLADLGTDNYDQELSLSLLENEEGLLEQTAEALRRIEAGTYGACVECGKAINAERLAALPHTPYCITCANRAERAERASRTAPT